MLLQLLAVTLLLHCACVHVHGAAPKVDVQRPQYHFLPPDNYMNDPNGLMYFNGIYHMFYQYNNDTDASGPKSWGHAVSKDMVYWRHLPLALVSDQPYDIGGVWSGSTTIVDGVPTIFYTGIDKDGYGIGESQNIAVPADLSDPYLVEWIKSPNNPIMTDLPPITPYSGFRDPSTGWQSEGSWYMIVGSGNPGIQGVSLLYTSSDYQNWTYVHELFTAPIAHFQGDMFECSDFFQLNGVWVFKASIMQQGDMWVTGDWDNIAQVFTPYYNVEGRYDFGEYYSSKSFLDAKEDRRIVFGFIQEDDVQSNIDKRGWAGLQSLPRQVTLNSDNTLSLTPIDDLQKLRTTHYSVQNQQVTDGKMVPLSFSGMQLEIEMDVVSAAPDASFGLRVRASATGHEFTDIIISPSVVQYNADCPGNDFAGHTMSSTDYHECETLCNQNTRCYAWTFTAADDVEQYGSCLLKNWANDFVTGNRSLVSGAKSFVTVNRVNSSLTVPVDYQWTQVMPLSTAGNKLQVFIDHSVIEIYANGGRAVLTSRVYPSLADSQGVLLFSNGGTVIVNVDAWSLASIWS